jgi:hypothetical protein
MDRFTIQVEVWAEETGPELRGVLIQEGRAATGEGLSFSRPGQ